MDATTQPTLPADLAARALEQAGDGIIVIDAEGIVRLWNAHATTLFGFSADEAIGRDVKLIIPERLQGPHDRAFFAAMASGHLASDGRARRTKGVRSDGEYVYVTMTFAMLRDAAGRAIGSVAVAREFVREA